MTNDNSDYDRVRTNLYDLLPEVYQSDVNKAMFENLFNRFLTKQETEKVAGYIGKGNSNAIASRQIVEPTVHRQAFQLQPILFNKIGSVEHTAAWYDILNELERLGVDIERLPIWGAVQEFNWAPPIDLDKLIHYQNYYWYDPENPSSTPQYMTIRSRCSTAIANANFWERLTEEFGLIIPFKDLWAVDEALPSYDIQSLAQPTQDVVIAGDATGYLIVGNTFNITGTASNNGEHRVVTTPVFDGIFNNTTFKVDGTITATEVTAGKANIQRFNKLIVDGEFERLFDPEFVLFVKDTLNVDLNNAFWSVEKSEYVPDDNITIVTLANYVTDSHPTGNISNEEQLNFYLAERDCQCEGAIGWDLLLWDDNPDDPLWGGAPPGEHDTLLTSITNILPPILPGTDGQLWYSTVTDILYQYRDNNTTTGWFSLWNNFSVILTKTEGMAFWDFTPGCGVTSRIPAADQWIQQNHWLHETDVTNFSIAKQAQYPIIEYDWDLELNAWAFTNTVWQYRAEKTLAWEATDAKPSVIELQPLTWWQENGFEPNEIILDERYGDLTEWFTPGTEFQAVNTIDVYVVDYSYYAADTEGAPFNTRVVITEPVAGSTLLTGDFAANRPSLTGLRPLRTSQGDAWRDYGDQWLFIAYDEALPVPHQPNNPFTVIDETQTATPDPSGDYEYIINYAAEQYSLETAGVSLFPLSTVVLSNTLRPLTRRALLGFDDVRVYVNTIRQYGNYNELADDLIAVSGVTSIANSDLQDTWTFATASDITTFMSVGDDIEIDGNTGGGSGLYRITGFIGTDTIITDDGIYAVPATSTPTGTAANTDAPMDGVSDAVASYVRGIEFIAGVNLIKYDIVKIEVGESSIEEIGLYQNPVRFDADNVEFANNGFTDISIVNSRRVEQVKSQTSQYPLFDIYNIDGTPAYRANPIFGYRTDPSYDVVAGIGLRIVRDPDTGVVEFDQFILDEDEGTVYAYRDYSNEVGNFWFDPTTNELMFWDDFLWNDKTTMSTLYAQGTVSPLEPDQFYKNFDGYYWYDTTNDELKRWTLLTSTWITIDDVDVLDHDVTLQTIWKKGLNNETYIPRKVDWERRTLAEYTEARLVFTVQRAQDLMLIDASLTLAQALAQANTEWLDSQKNSHSEDGQWVGDWEIPDPLYYNNQHENRKYLDTRELLTHFATIIDEQPKIPGYNGPKDSMFHLIPTNDVNYGLGGTIKEYNDGFDTFLSSIFINNVTPLKLIDFAHDQYEALLNNMKEQYRKNAVSYFTNVSTLSVLNLDTIITESLILAHELNDNAARIYGDSTTFTDVEGGQDIGVRNWIATQPYIQTLFKQLPYKIVDPQLGFVEISHHDGHRNQYALAPSLIEGIINLVNNTDDDRTRYPGPSDPAVDTLGRTSAALPPNTAFEFDAEYNTSIDNRSGVYWYSVQGDTRVWYRLVVASAGTAEPSSALADGTLWFDTELGLETLRVKTTAIVTGIVTWEVVSGLSLGDGRLHNGTDPSDITTATVSAYQPININEYINDVILEVEQRLYDNAPEPFQLAYDPVATREINPPLFDSYLEDAFLTYTLAQGITSPYGNDNFNLTEPFTWNYKYSTPGAGLEILEADSATNTFRVPGDVTATFDPCNVLAICGGNVSFFIKNSGVNDGSWETILSLPTPPSAVYDTINNETIIFVTEDVVDSNDGIIYPPDSLPSSANDGSESGGDWRDYYEKLYGTPYPHLEPWVLQGYAERPDWWVETYYNDDPEKWGIRNWKYRHGFDIAAVDTVNDRFIVEGDFREAWLAGGTYGIDKSPGVHDGLYSIPNLATINAVNAGPSGLAYIEVLGDVTATFVPGIGISVNSTTGLTTGVAMASVTVSSSLFALGVTKIYTVEPIVDTTNWDVISGVTYNSLLDHTVLNVAENITDATVEGRLLNAWGMWENIRQGRIPPGQIYSNGITSITGQPSIDAGLGLQVPDINTYQYFSVNIDNVDASADGGTTVYPPDQIFPPFWDYTGYLGVTISPFDFPIRSVFFNFSTEIVAPGTDFVFGDSGDIEWEWRQTSQFLYDMLNASFRLDPVRYVADTFGINIDIVNALELDGDQQNTFSHNRTYFHGDIVGDQPYLVNGTNQWYMNYNRFAGFDTTWSDFRSMWTLWTAPLMYQFSSFIDTPSLSVAQRAIPVTEFDYDVIAKRSLGVEDDWLDAFDVAITHIPPAIIRYDNQNEWRFEIRTNLPSSRAIKYYDVHNYQFYADPDTDLCTLYKWDVAKVDAFNDTISVPGNQTHVFTEGREFTVTGSLGNDGTYITAYSAFNSVEGQTIIELSSGEIAAPVADGVIEAIYREMPWQTGDMVALSTAETMPVPLSTDTVNGLVFYFIIRENDRQFRLALTPNDALIDSYISINTKGTRDTFVGQIDGTFQVDPSLTNWRRYATDKSNLLSFSTPDDINGMQNLVDIIQGYNIYSAESGWVINEDMSLRDPNSNAAVNWQTETERFINFAYTARISRDQVADRYTTTVDEVTNVWTWADVASQSAKFITGDQITVLSSSGVYPTPIARGLTYYMIRDDIATFKLAATKQDAEAGVEIDITSTVGIGTLWVTTLDIARDNAPSQEINPFRNGIWYRPERGIVSNIITGPAEDVRTTQLIFDQYGRGIRFDDLLVMRLDKMTQIRYADEVFNDVELTSVFQDPYNYLHMGGMHVFVDSYEHVLKFNDYTSQNQLIYDPFLGLNISKFEMLFNRQDEFTGRPNVGGYYLETFFNQGADLNQNIESQTEELRYLYDTYNVIESNPMTAEGRRGLGYEGTKTYLDNLNLNQKSQFIFWRGMIQQKGSVNAVNAFVNSRRFIDAKVDDFWAIKIAEYGSAYEKEYPEMWITTQDARASDIRWQFVREDDFCNPGFAVDDFDDTDCGFSFPDEAPPQLLLEPGFEGIALADQDRWFEQPDQLEVLRNNGEGMYFDMEVDEVLGVHVIDDADPSPPEARAYVEVNGGSGDGAFAVRDANDVLRPNGEWLAGDDQTMRHNLQSDTVAVMYQMYPANNGHQFSSTGVTGTTLVIDDYIPFTQMLKVYKNGNLLTALEEFTEITFGTSVLISNEIVFAVPLLTSDEIVVVYGFSVLTKDYHYEDVNANIIRFLFPALTNPAAIGRFFTIWSALLNKEAQNPARLLDKKSEVVVKNIQHWDPARGWHYQNGIHNVDLQRDSDPAVYTNKLTAPIVPQITPPTDPTEMFVDPWNDNEQNVTWMSTAHQDYVPYYDELAIVDLEERLRLWGQLAAWSTIPLYEWISSDVPPDEYDELAAQEQGDISIPENIRKTGNARKVLYVPSLPGGSIGAIDTVAKQFTIDDHVDTNLPWVGSVIAAGGSITNPPAFTGSYTIVSYVLTTGPRANGGTGDVTEFIVEEEIPSDQFTPFDDYLATWKDSTANDRVAKLDCAIEGEEVIDGYEFEVASILAQGIFAAAPVDVYVNGLLHEEQVTLDAGSPGIYFAAATKDADRVTFVQFGGGIDQDFVDEQVSAGLWRQETPYTLTTKYDALGLAINTYNFWVENKTTKGKASRTMSPLEAQQNIVTIPDPYIFFLRPIEAEYADGAASTYTRDEYFEMDTSLVITTAENIATVNFVTIDGIQVPYVVTGPTTITIPSGMVGDSGVVSYVSPYVPILSLPTRFTQAVIRGLRGLIDADNRYTIRYTRDFTLRDNLDFGKTQLDLKNDHVEWEIFRRSQQFHINKWQWDRLTESLVGYTLADSTIRVPTYERELYDNKYGTDTRYGLGAGQSFTDGALSLQTIIAYLLDPDNDFYPTDINVFFQRESFDTPEDVANAMETIYNTFTHEHVNNMYFNCLLDAFSVKHKYEEIFKTSMIALHGIRPFQINGAFDD